MDEAPKIKPTKLDLLTQTAFYNGQRITLHGVVLEVVEVLPTRIVLAANNDPVIVERFAEREARWREMDKRHRAHTAELVGRIWDNIKAGKPVHNVDDEPAPSESSASDSESSLSGSSK